MKKLLLLTIAAVAFTTISYAQNEAPASKPVAEIFADFHASPKQDKANPTGFAVNRAFFGYNFTFDKNFYAVFILNIGSPEDLVNGSKAKRYAFFREASANYSNDGFTVTMGMIKTTLFMYQQTFLGMRYIAKPFQDLSGYGTDADLGAAASYKFNDALQADLSIINGEGGGNLAIDNNLKYCGGLSIKPSKNFVVRFYDDIMKNKSVFQNESLVFTGLRMSKFFIGGEFNFKTNLDTIGGHHAYGVSATGGLNLSEKVMFFSRYDFSLSVKPDGFTDDWNYKKDFQFMIVGVQYSASKALRVSLDYQGKFPYDKTKSSTQMIFLNLGFKI